ncbi:MAG TPA: hypothetical protein VFQ45_20765 [Longimicrobium sp.]|nr:hypothetical protein [Longimicrobium sp.]
MARIVLKPEELRVDSFPTAPDPAETAGHAYGEQGTVGFTCGNPPDTETTCEDMRTLAPKCCV